MIKKLTIDDVARMSQEQFTQIDEQLTDLKTTVLTTHADLKHGQARLLEALVGIPSKSVIASLATKLDDHEDRIEKVERKLASQ